MGGPRIIWELPTAVGEPCTAGTACVAGLHVPPAQAGSCGGHLLPMQPGRISEGATQGLPTGAIQGLWPYVSGWPWLPPATKLKLAPYS